MSNGVACPKCGNNDQSQKISAIVTGGTGTFAGAGTAGGPVFIGGKVGLPAV